MLLDEGFVSRSRLFEKDAGLFGITTRQRGAAESETFPANKRWRKFFAGEVDQHFFRAGEIELLRASEICQRLTPAALPPVDRTDLIENLGIVWDCLCRDRELLQRIVVISLSHPEPKALRQMRFGQIWG